MNFKSLCNLRLYTFLSSKLFLNLENILNTLILMLEFCKLHLYTSLDLYIPAFFTLYKFVVVPQDPCIQTSEAFEFLTLCPFHEEHVFNSPRKNATHKSGENKKETRRNTQSASRRASGILCSCEMCKSRQKTFSLIFRTVRYRKRRCHPHAQHIISLIYLRHPVYLFHATAHFSLAL